MNRVVLVGRITKDPEIRYTTSGIPNVNFTIAVDRGMKDANGERQADFINCVAWRNHADFISKYIKKGFLIALEGKIQTRSYQSTTDNQMRYVTEVLVDTINNLQPRDPQQGVAQVPPTQGYQQPRNNYQNTGYQQSNSYDQGNASYQSQTGYQAPKSPSYQQNNADEQVFSVDVAEDDLPF